MPISCRAQLSYSGARLSALPSLLRQTARGVAEALALDARKEIVAQAPHRSGQLRRALDHSRVLNLGGGEYIGGACPIDALGDPHKAAPRGTIAKFIRDWRGAREAKMDFFPYLNLPPGKRAAFRRKAALRRRRKK